MVWQIDMARSGDNGVEDSLTAEHHVLEPRDCLDIHGAGGIHGRQISGIHHQGLTGVQVVFHDMPVELGEGNPPAGELLHDEALAAEKPEPSFFWKKTDSWTPASLARKPLFCTTAPGPDRCQRPGCCPGSWRQRRSVLGRPGRCSGSGRWSRRRASAQTPSPDRRWCWSPSSCWGSSSSCSPAR